MTIFNDAANLANSIGFGGWKLSKPNEYRFSFRSRHGYYNKASFSIDTNFNNSFKVAFKLRF